MKIAVAGFRGENRAIHNKELPDTVGVTSTNQKPGRGDLRPWRLPLAVASIPAGRQTMYRMGRDVQSDANYWLSWTTDVYAVRGMVADDTTEKTYFTGSGTPKVTDNTMALASAPYPTTSRPLGIPAPATKLTASFTPVAVDADIGKYRISISADRLASFAVGDQLKLVMDTKTDQTITLTAGTGGKVTAASLAANIDAANFVTAVVMPATDTTIPEGVRVTGDVLKLGFKLQKTNGTASSYADADVTYQTLGLDTIGGTTTPAEMVFTQSSVTTNFPAGTRYQVLINQAAPVSITVAAGANTVPAASTTTSLRDALKSVVGITAVESVNGSGVPILTVTTVATGNGARIRIQRIIPLSTTIWVDLLTGAQVTATNPAIESVFYVYTYVNDWGWESGPSPFSDQINKPESAEVTLTGFSPPPAGNYNITRIRVYKAESATTGDAALFVMQFGATEATASFDLPIATTTATDKNYTLGQTLESALWLPAPDDLSCLTPLWNGMLAGISGNAFRFCEPYVPYSWPLGYDKVPSNSKPVAIGVFGQTMLGLTTGRPVVIAGSSPDSLDDAPVESMQQGCVASRSVVSMGTGVAWASNDGLCWFGAGGPRILTAGILTREQWLELVPSSITGCMYEGLYFGSYDNGSGRKGFIVNPAETQGMYFLDVGYRNAHFDELQDQLYVLDGPTVARWDAGASFMTATFRSKVFRTPRPVSMGCAQVIADAYPVDARFFADGTLKHFQTVTSNAPFRLPSGFTANEWQAEIVTTKPVQVVFLAQFMHELKDVPP